MTKNEMRIAIRKKYPSISHLDPISDLNAMHVAEMDLCLFWPRYLFALRCVISDHTGDHYATITEEELMGSKCEYRAEALCRVFWPDRFSEKE